MLKVILSVFLSFLLLLSVVVVWYWRDAQFEPTAIDFVVYFVFLPLGLSLLLLSPYLLSKWRQKRKDDLERQQQAQLLQQQSVTTAQTLDLEPVWHRLDLYSASLHSALGENQDLLSAIVELSGPTLDPMLVDGLGNPILSYRMQEIDQALLETDSDQTATQSQQYLRLEQLLQTQLEQHIQALSGVAAHLKHSALFYDSQLAYEYRMHPAWINPETAQYVSADPEVEPEPSVAAQVARLNRLNVHILLPQHCLHRFDEQQMQSKIHDFFAHLGVLTQQVSCRYHYLSAQDGYSTWLQILTDIEQQPDQISLLLVADSDLDQDILDEKSYTTTAYLPAEFSGSCLIAAPQVQIDQLQPIQKIDIVFNQKSLNNSLELLDLQALEQYQDETAFVSILESPSQKQVFKILQQRFNDTPIDSSHFVYSKSSLGHTESLSKIFGFMLAMQFDQSAHSMIYSTEYSLTQVFISPAEIMQSAQEPV